MPERPSVAFARAARSSTTGRRWTTTGRSPHPTTSVSPVGITSTRTNFGETAEVDHMLENRVMENASPAPASADMASPETVGLAAGGAKDVANFRENVANGYTPQPEAISDEGLFYDYHFETGTRTESDALFAPRYAASVSDHPISGKAERYLSVGLDSTLSVDEFERPRLDLVAVLDVSGSMDSPLTRTTTTNTGASARPRTTRLRNSTRRPSRCVRSPSNSTPRTAWASSSTTTAPTSRNRSVMSERRICRRSVATSADRCWRQYEPRGRVRGGRRHVGRRDAQPDVERRVVFMTDMMPNTGATGTVNSRSCSRTRPQRASHDVHRHGAGRERGAGGHLVGHSRSEPLLHPLGHGVLSVGWARSSTTWSLRWSTT